jgi:hypothetical protein
MRPILFCTLALIADCSPTTPGPVQISQCAIRAVPAYNQYQVVYKFHLSNETGRAISALRIGYSDWDRHAAVFPSGPTVVYDDYRPLAPHASHFLFLHTSPSPASTIAGRLRVARTRLREWQPLTCMTVSLWFANGSTWVAPGPPGAVYALPRYRDSSEAAKASHSL